MSGQIRLRNQRDTSCIILIQVHKGTHRKIYRSWCSSGPIASLDLYPRIQLWIWAHCWVTDSTAGKKNWKDMKQCDLSGTFVGLSPYLTVITLQEEWPYFILLSKSSVSIYFGWLTQNHTGKQILRNTIVSCSYVTVEKYSTLRE